MKMFATAIVFPLLVAACSRTKQSGDQSHVQAVSHTAAGAVYDLTDALEMQDLLLNSKTKLEVSQAEFLRLRPVLPDQLRILTDGLVPTEAIANLGVKTSEALIDFTLVADHYDVVAEGQPTLRFANHFALKRVLPSDSIYDFARISVDGVTVANQPVEYLYLLKNGNVQLGVAGAVAETTVAIPSLTALFQAGDVTTALLPSNSAVAGSLFAAADILRTLEDGNILHIKAKKLGADGQPLIDAEGRPIPNREYKFRKLLRDQLANANLDPQLLAVLDNITDILVDKDGIQIWLSEAVDLNFSAGSAGFDAYFKLQSTGPTTLIPVSGIKASSPEADGAYVQEIRLDGDETQSSVTVDVYGYRNTLFGAFGQTKSVNFPL